MGLEWSGGGSLGDKVFPVGFKLLEKPRTLNHPRPQHLPSIDAGGFHFGPEAEETKTLQPTGDVQGKSFDLPYIASDELREFFDERPGLHAAILGTMGLIAAIACLTFFISGERFYRGWAALILVVVFWGQAVYRLMQIRNNRLDG